MSELRLDPTSRDWVIVAPERGFRPHPAPGPSSECPFCPGAEDRTPAELFRSGNGNSWKVRVVPNAFPVLRSREPRGRRATGPFVAMSGYGHHEVVVDSPDHTWDPATGDPADILDVLHAYRARYTALRDTDAVLVSIFRNSGRASGSSLEHPHSQIVATPVVPPLIRRRFDVARTHFDEHGTCLYLETVRGELDDGRRIVAETPFYVAFVPYAAAFPFEVWIMPRNQRASFDAAAPDELEDLAVLLRSLLGGLYTTLERPAYNLTIHSAPLDDEREEYFVWHIQIVPRISTPAGFEIATGVQVNPVLPEEAATSLRGAIQG